MSKVLTRRAGAVTLAGAVAIAIAVVATTTTAGAGWRRYYADEYYYPRSFRYPYYPFGGYGLGDGSPASYRNRAYVDYDGSSSHDAVTYACTRRIWTGRRWVRVACPCE
jgi:hypothetical protein